MKNYLIVCKICLLSVFFILVSCKTITKTVEIPVETIKKEYINNIKTDSIIIRDSIDRYVSGDTVFIYKEKTKYKYLTSIDTIIKTDSIPKVITLKETKEVEVNHIYWYQKILMWFGVIAMGIILIYLLYKIKLK